MEKKTKGAWIIHHTNKLQTVSNQHGFENIYMAGKAGLLLSAISTDSQTKLDNNKVKALAKAANINTRLELPSLLDFLKKKDLIEIGNSGIDVLGVTGLSALQHTSEIFEDLGPDSSEGASIELSEKASLRPQDKKLISVELADKFRLSSRTVNQLLSDAEQIGFVDAEKVDRETVLYFNGNLFRRDETLKINAVLNSLTHEEQSLLNEFSEKLKAKACITVDEAKKLLGKKLFEKLSSVSLFDINTVSNNTETVGFVTRPSAFSKFSNSIIEDAFDLAKAFVSALTYGMTRSTHTRGKITMIKDLLRVLIRGEWVGPVNAIGEDYKILETKHVVEVKWGSKVGWAGRKRTGYLMRVLKKEVAFLALQVFVNGRLIMSHFRSSKLSHPQLISLVSLFALYICLPFSR